MENIKCPKCGEIFTVDESTYSKLLHEIKNVEFEKELHEKLNNLKEMQEVESKLAIKEISEKKEKEINDLKAQLLKVESNLALNAKDNEVAIKDALAKQATNIEVKDNTILSLQKELENQKKALKLELENALVKEKSASDKSKSDLIALYSEKISKLEATIANNEVNTKLAIQNEKDLLNKKINEQCIEINNMKNELKNKENENKLELANLEEKHKAELEGKDNIINYYKDLKTKMSTKLVGETLEQHCLIEFNRIRPTAFNTKNVYFDKDNDASSGSKGDFIYRETTDDGVEVLSIMFEMKNENDTTATKHKNSDFFKELDKDRKEKKCEYAILVSMLEADNELYNSGITDVSYEYEKMYVVRPQCFIPIITLLRNAALNNVNARRELMKMMNQNADLTRFEQNLLDFQNDFQYNFEQASKKFDKSIEEIDKAISSLQKTKDYLLGVNNQLRIANGKAQNVTVKKLTKNAPSVKDTLDEIRKNNQ